MFEPAKTAVAAPSSLCSGYDHPPLKAMFEAAGVTFAERVPMLWREVHGKTLGGFAWSSYTGDTIQAHLVGISHHWMNREIVRRSFTYPFQELGVKCILAFLPEHRTEALSVALGMGFKELGVIPKVNIHALTLVREDCERWLALPSRG